MLKMVSNLRIHADSSLILDTLAVFARSSDVFNATNRHAISSVTSSVWNYRVHSNGGIVCHSMADEEMDFVATRIWPLDAI